MRLLVILVLNLLFTSIVYAETWICFDETTKMITNTLQGDCYKSGLCSGYNNSGLLKNCFEASKEEFDKARQSQVKIDTSIVTGNRVVDWIQEEKDTVIAEELAKVESQAAKKQSLIDKLKGLGFTDEDIALLIN